MIYPTDKVKLEFGIPWPGFDRKDYGKMTGEQLIQDYYTKKRIEEAALSDPVKFGWTLESWREFFDEFQNYHTHVLLGGNRSAKSTCIARTFIHLLESIPEARLRAYHVSDAKSITEQQEYIWQALPKKYKDLSGKRDSRFSTTYSQKNGFVSNKLILPPQPGYARGSEIIFGTYQQYRNDPQVVEGWWAHAIWCDEEAPHMMFMRMLTRLYDAKGKMILSFTTIQGWSALVADILGKTRTLRKRAAPLLGNREIPVAQESVNRPGTRIYYLWTDDNPFIPHETTKRMMGRPEAEILAVAYGIPTRSATTKFPQFNKQVHVLKDEKLPWNLPQDDPGFARKESFTLYQSIDPAGSKPWYIIWAAVARDGTIIVYRDWPDIAYGNWGEPSSDQEGTKGEAMKPNGYGIFDYVETMQQLEDGEEIFERIIDPRMGVARTPGKDGATSIQSELEQQGITVFPAPALDIEHGIQLINDRLAYNEEKPVDSVNHPRMYFSASCEQTIQCLENYTGCSRTEVWKEAPDVLRYLLETGAYYVEKRAMQDSGATFSY